MHRQNKVIGSAAVFFLLFTTTAKSQENRVAQLESRVQELEDRIKFLETALRTLVEQKGGAAELPAPAPSAEPSPERSVPSVRAASTVPPPNIYTPPELVPEIGKIGAEVGLLLSRSANPFGLNNGTFGGGFIDLPLLNAPAWMRGKIGYEIMVGMSQSNTITETTSNVAQVANLAVLSALNPNGGLNNVVAAVTGTGPAPFPVKTSASTRLRLLEVMPFSLKYTSTALDRWRIRPYALIGFGVYVTIHHQNPLRGTPPTYGVRPDADLPPEILGTVGQIFGGQAPFGGPLVAGQISQAPELEARGLPGGHGNMDFGYVGGLGFEYRLTRSLSLGFDNRFNRIAGSPGLLTTFGTRIAVHF